MAGAGPLMVFGGHEDHGCVDPPFRALNCQAVSAISGYQASHIVLIICHPFPTSPLPLNAPIAGRGRYLVGSLGALITRRSYFYLSSPSHPSLLSSPRSIRGEFPSPIFGPWQALEGRSVSSRMDPGGPGTGADMGQGQSGSRAVAQYTIPCHGERG
jgi:hypothetical protein